MNWAERLLPPAPRMTHIERRARHAEWIALHRAGYTNQDIAQRYGVSRLRVWQVVSGKPYILKPPKVTKERDAAWIGLYREGKTLQEIGTQYGVTRERVRQRLAANGINRTDSPRPAAIAARRAAAEVGRRERVKGFRDRQHGRSYGVTRAEWEAIAQEFGPGVFVSYRRLRQNCRRAYGRDAWQLTFLEWLNLWRASGKWSERGQGAYGVLRRDPSGPYRANNSFIGSVGQHIRSLHRAPEWRAKWEAQVAAKNLASEHA